MDLYKTLQIVKTVGSTFKDTLQASYFQTNKSLKASMLKVFRQELGEVVQSGLVLAITEAQMMVENR